MNGKFIALVGMVLTLSGCAASLTFVDRENGSSYYGKTEGATINGNGEVSSEIDGIKYSGTWIYSASGGGYSLSNSNATVSGSRGYASGFGSSTSLFSSAQGNGLINMKSTTGQFIRCVFNFNTLSNTGMGECQRNDGRLFDVQLKR